MLSDELRNILKGEVDNSPEALEKVSRDASLYRVVPEVIVRPKDGADIEALVKFVSEKKRAGEHISITPRAGGTDMSGGPLNDSIILDIGNLNRIYEIGDSFAVAEPGVYFRDFDRETKKKNLELPSYTASREICTVGGMTANNSGGEKNLKYGKTARYVEEIEAVLSDGAVHTFKKFEGEALSSKLAEDSFEGEVYRKMSELLSKNRSTIEKARPKVSKNSSGYALWDAGDGVTQMDLTKVLVGSQGTLGIFTKMRFGLVRPKPKSSMLVIFLKNLNDLGVVIPKVLAREPDSFESYDDHTFEIAVKYFPEFAVQMKANLFSLGVSFIPEVLSVVTGGVPKLVLLVEFREEEQGKALEKVRALKEEIRSALPKVKTHIAKNESEARKYWTVRRESFNLLRKKIRGMRTAPFIDDFVVPPETLPEFLPKLSSVLSEYDLTYTIAGHVGDGNFHIIPLIDPKRKDARRIINELSKKTYDLVLSYQGSISGEHNDGYVRTPYVEQMFGKEMAGLFAEVQNIFDPLDIFNPGKKVGTDVAGASRHLDLPA